MSAIIDSLTAYLPTTPGLLPKWMLFVSTMAIFNTIQNFVTTKLSKQIYLRKPGQVTPLASRTFGTWTLTSAIVRLYAAYHLTNPQIYQLTYWTYIIAFAHFGLEWMVYGTAGFGKGLIGPLVVSTSSMVWMTMQKEYYLGL
ncbi:Erg28-like protein [Saitoella complicata NRRL Y-17804]|uniref:Ergosterol biosynthesis protein n=1 Tax=Saitoella complicata (strain BCRC 22490 / CBS 7301 / JCM 7358 / NBRC 10748 / NRRL Y-17804) TaxID=698492 RepID=A0A0E9NIJ1_SAICN|nr:Erg28-like protein [Saitoella complicata NRRL Y-17804]ODQ50954.1 Erg28-like protein [Saitoella complicata NRRL Y-17804]GAO49664.1 hypothetical protein G7K_3811-t1 [Saitoella complicata NRRL Y-17804]